MISFKNFPLFFSIPLTFSLCSLSPLPSLSILFPFHDLILTRWTSSPCSFLQKKVMFLPRKIPSSTPYTPARKKGWLIRPSSGLTWLWLVATAFQTFFQKSYILFYLAKYSKVLLYSLFIIFVKRNIFPIIRVVLIIPNVKKNKPMWKLFVGFVENLFNKAYVNR